MLRSMPSIAAASPAGGRVARRQLNGCCLLAHGTAGDAHPSTTLCASPLRMRMHSPAMKRWLQNRWVTDSVARLWAEGGQGARRVSAAPSPAAQCRARLAASSRLSSPRLPAADVGEQGVHRSKLVGGHHVRMQRLWDGVGGILRPSDGMTARKRDASSSCPRSTGTEKNSHGA